MVAFSRFLARVQTSKSYTEELKNSLALTVDTGIFAGLDVFAFADKLKESGAIIDEAELDSIADYLRSEMIRLGMFDSVQASQPVVSPIQFPTSLKLEVDKTPLNMTLSELLDHLGKNPNDTEAKQELMRRPLIVQTTTIVGLRFAFKTETGLDSQKTLRFINHIASGKPSPRKFEDSFAISLDSSLGLSNVIWFNPLLKGQKLYDGIDYENDINWNEINPQIRESVLWSRFNQHKNFPSGDIDIWTEFEKIPSGTGRWKNIIEDYKRYLSEDNAPITLKFVEGIEDVLLQILAEPGSQSSGTRRDGTPSLSFNDLSQLSIGDVISGNSTKNISNCIVDKIRTGNGDIHCSNVICLGSITTGNSELYGTIYCQLRTQVREGNSSSHATLIRLSEVELVEKAIQLGLTRN